jgi:pathogenesis-related protein 1
VFAHSGGALGPFGEDIAAGTNEMPAGAVASWAAEASAQPLRPAPGAHGCAGKYDAAHPAAADALHLTQMVWKSTCQLGCAYAACGAGTVFKNGPGVFHVCEYFPRGNVKPNFP